MDSNQTPSSSKLAILLPIIVAVSACIGFLLNGFFTNSPSSLSVSTPQASSKINAVLNVLENQYYKEVDTDSIVEEIVPEVLQKLDPHTVYISSEQMDNVREDMNGRFSGIGIQFIKYQDTVVVVRPIEDGPSERAGILAGDRLVSVNDSLIAGRKLSTDTIMTLLKGRAGSDVQIGITRRGAFENRPMIITRGPIPVPSVDISYMLNETVGYIKINQFGRNTYNEFMLGILTLKEKGMQKLIVDLRGNPGGLLDIAVKMVNEFLKKNELVVYIKGKSRAQVNHNANGKGHFQDLPITVLIDEFSASASEIFAGAIQDHDRGMVIGRRSFGKGLVQEQIEFPDNSAIRLTVSEYFTPSGRNIQKPFEDGEEGKKAYHNDINQRYSHGEFTQKDSIQFDDSLKFTTDKGRTVYGGGGIMPDLFVPLDTTEHSNYYELLLQKGLIYNFAFDYTDRHRRDLEKLPDYQAVEQFMESRNYLNDFFTYTQKEQVPKDNYGYAISKDLLQNQLKASVVRNIFDDKGFYPIYHRKDEILQKALEEIQK